MSNIGGLCPPNLNIGGGSSPPAPQLLRPGGGGGGGGAPGFKMVSDIATCTSTPVSTEIEIGLLMEKTW